MTIHLQRLPLTPMQMFAMGAIIEIWNLEGRSPTMLELSREMDQKSRSGAQRLVNILRRKGWLLPVRRRERYGMVPAIAGVFIPRGIRIELDGKGRAALEQLGVSFPEVAAP